MGYSYLFTCKECKHSQKLYEGWGFMIHDQPAKERTQSNSIKFHYKTHQKINNLSITHPDLQLKMEYRIFRCHRCLQISDKLFVQAIHNNQVLHKTQFRCTNCHTTLKHTNIHSLKYVICPKCKSHRFKKQKELMLWD